MITLPSALLTLAFLLAEGARVVNTVPAAGAEVDPNTEEIHIVFGADMLQLPVPPDRVEGLALPEMTGAPYFKNPRTMVLSVKLEPEKEYGLGVNQRAGVLKTADGDGIEAYVLKFRTGKDYGRIFGWSPLERKAREPGQVYVNVLVREGDQFEFLARVKFSQEVAQTMRGPAGESQGGRNSEDLAAQTGLTEFLSIEKGEILSMKRTYGDAGSISKMWMPGPNRPPPQVHEEAYKYAHKTYLLTRKDDAYQVTAEGRTVTPQEADPVGKEVILPDLLPTRRFVRRGETWKLESMWLDQVVPVLVGGVSVTRIDLKMTLEEVRARGDLRFAMLKISGALTVEHKFVETETEGTVPVNGLVIVDLTNRRYVSVDIMLSSRYAGVPKAARQYGFDTRYEEKNEGRITLAWKYP